MVHGEKTFIIPLAHNYTCCDAVLLLVGSCWLFVKCAHFCFGQVLQNSLDSLREQWNSHYIRKSVSSEVQGRPDYNFLLPPEGFSDYGTEVNPNDAASIQDFVNDYLESENVNDNFELFKPRAIFTGT